jgi:hypothetical protein
MKKYYLIMVLLGQLAILPNIYSQNVSINSTGSLPDASAMLDISSTTSGFLVPRMTTAQQNAIASPATGLLIYNTTTGYFMVNTGTPASPVWTPLAFNNTGWSLLGNSGTVDGTNFLGTTDNVPLNFKVNNQKAGRIDNTNANTFFGYQAGNSNTSGIQNTFIGQQAGYNNSSGWWNTFVGDSAGYSTTSGYRNTSIGYQSLFNNTTGWFNNAFGHKTLYSNTTGSDNMAVGQAALYGNTTGIHNIAVGNYTLENTTSGGNNTAVGYASLYNNNDATGDNTAVGYNAMYISTSGKSNTAIGTGTLTNTTGNYNTAIGNNTGATNTTGSNNTFVGTNANPSTGALTNATAIGYNAIVGASNSLVLGGTGANAVNVGIGTTTPSAQLHIGAGTALANSSPLKFTPGTNLTTPETGAVEFDGINAYITNETIAGRGAIPVEQHFLLTAVGSTIGTSSANYFGTTSNIPLASGGYYEIDIYCYFLKSTANTVTWTFTNSSAPTSMDIHYDFSASSGIVSTAAATSLFGDQYNLTVTAPTVVTASLTSGANHYAHFKIILLNGTGTSLQIQAKCGSGTMTPGIGSRWYCKRISTSNVGTFAN